VKGNTVTTNAPLGIAIVGAGKAGRNMAHAVAASHTAEVIHVVSRTPQSAERLAAEVQAEHHGTDLDAALSDPRVEAVYVASPDRFHCEQTLAAVRARKHVLCEKPMCRSTGEAERMIRAAAEAGVTLMVGFSERFMQPCREAKERIAGGEIGTPVMILARRCHPKSIVRGRDWLTDTETGGVLDYAGTHNMDLICWYMDSPPVRVYAEMGQLVLREQGFTDCAVVTFQFQNGGIAALYESFAYPDPYPHSVDRSIEILGTRGRLMLDLMRQPLSVDAESGFHVADAVAWPRVEGRLCGALVEEINHFVRAIRNGDPVLTPGAAGLQAMRIAEAAHEACRTGRAVLLG